nr:F-box/kelch-repeat protein At1g57790-like [Ipomoea batatas]
MSNSSIDEAAGTQKSWSDLNQELLSGILTRLAMGDYYTFQSVCRSWKSITPLPRSLLPISLEHASPCDIDLYEDLHLMYLNKKTCLFNFYDPTRNINYSLNILQLLDDDIGEVELYYANYGWFLFGKGAASYFFFNPTTKVTIDLPDTPDIPFSFVCFSESPTSPNCQIVGILSVLSDFITVGILNLGEDSWSLYPQIQNDIDYIASSCTPVIRNRDIYILGESGNLGKLRIPRGKHDDYIYWDIIGKSHRQQFIKFRDRFLLQSDGDLMCVATLEEGEVRVLKLDSKMVWQKVENLKGKTFYVSPKMSLSREATVRGISNKIYFPKFYDGKGVFYCLATKKWRNFPQSFSSVSCGGRAYLRRALTVGFTGAAATSGRAELRETVGSGVASMMEKNEIVKTGDGFIDRSKVRILLCDNGSKSSEEVFTLLCKCSYQGY